MSSANTRSIGPLDPADATPLPLQAGDVVGGRYEILRLLGSGGSAFVYAVRDRAIGDEIALKLLREGKRSDIDVERSRREAEFARGSASPRLVRTFDLSEADGFVFLTMELVSSGSLRDLLRRGPLPIDEAIRLACEILEALADLHRLDIVHRDLKPGNLLLTADGHIKLSDFGIARRWTDEESRLTRTGLPVGTVDYLSPEQAGAESVDPRSDLYSFGVVLFEMLTGRVPFQGPSAVGSIVMRLHHRATDVRKWRPDTPRWLAAVVARLLEAKREDRYASAVAALDDIRRKRVRISWRSLRVPIAVLAVLVALAAAFSQSRRSAAPQLVADGELGIRAIDAQGDTLWTRGDVRLDHATIVRRGRAREIAALLTVPNADPRDPVFTRTLSFLELRTGRVLRTRTLPSAPPQAFPEHSNRLSAASIVVTDLNADGYDEVVVSYHHDYWPSFTVLHDLRRDESRMVLVASGHHIVRTTEDIDGDGVEEIIFDGIANRQGWYNALTAIRVPLDGSRAFIASTPDRVEWFRGRSMLWYALCPPGQIREVIADRKRRVIRAEYENRPPVEMTFDGFDVPSASALAVRERQAARERAYARLRNSVRLANSGLANAAIEDAEAGRALAARAGDATLAEWSERLKGIALVRGGHFEEADALFTRLARSGTASEIAWDAGNAFHLASDLRRAVGWYRRNLGREGQPGVGRLKYETIQGVVLALGEMGRWPAALAELDRFEAGYANESAGSIWYRRYVAWRTGGTPAAAEHDLREPHDIFRYWALEIALARGGDPQRLLRAIDADLLRASETRTILLIARADALRRRGRVDEALQVAREGFLRLRGERMSSVLARAHFDLAAERLARLAEEKGLAAEAKQTRAEAAALRWHSNGMPR